MTQVITECLALAKPALVSDGSRAETFYDVFSTHNDLCETKLYLNFGYCKAALSYDHAGEALADLLFSRAEFQPNTQILDVGCGSGDQDMLWAQKYDVGPITALNITASQVELARSRIRAAADTYHQKLCSAGLKKIELESISDYGFCGFSEYASKRVKPGEITQRVNPIARWMWSATRLGPPESARRRASEKHPI